jgi:hypothetical protein
MRCTHRLDDGPLVCLLEEHPEHPNGHRYESTSGIANAAKEE